VDEAAQKGKPVSYYVQRYSDPKHLGATPKHAAHSASNEEEQHLQQAQHAAQE